MTLVRPLSFVLIVCLAPRPTAAQPAPADIVTVAADSAAAGSAADIPVYIRDTSGTALGVDQLAGSRIQSYSIKVDYAPSASVQSITFTRAGITAALTPSFESSPASSGSISLIDTFSESTNPIPFTSNAAAPGDEIGLLHVVVAADAAPGTITLNLDATLTQLTNESGTVNETVASGNLVLVDGSITVTAQTPVRLQSFDVE